MNEQRKNPVTSSLRGAARSLVRLRHVIPVVVVMTLCAGVTSAHAQGQMAFGGASSASLTANAVCPPNGGVCSGTTTSSVGLRVPFAMTISNLYAFQATAPTGSSSCSFVVKVSAGGTGTFSSTPLSCSITSTSGRTCANTGSVVTVNAGDIVQISFVETGTCSGYVNYGLRGSY